MKKPWIVAFINFKGGVGNTANVVNIGACLAKYHRKKVLIVDIDAQCNSTFWLLKGSHLSGMRYTPYYTAIFEALKDEVKEYDYVLIDCPPNIYGISKNALYFADAYVVPYLPDFLSLSGFRLFSRIGKSFQYQVSGYQGKKLVQAGRRYYENTGGWDLFHKRGV